MTLGTLILGIVIGTVLGEAVRRLRTLILPMNVRQLQLAAHKSHEILMRRLPNTIIVLLVADRKYGGSALVHNAESDSHVARSFRAAADAIDGDRFLESRLEGD